MKYFSFKKGNRWCFYFGTRKRKEKSFREADAQTARETFLPHLLFHAAFLRFFCFRLKMCASRGPKVAVCADWAPSGVRCRFRTRGRLDFSPCSASRAAMWPSGLFLSVRDRLRESTAGQQQHIGMFWASRVSDGGETRVLVNFEWVVWVRWAGLFHRITWEN